MARTTLIIPDALWRELKLRAAKENLTISDWVADAVKLKLQPASKNPAAKIKFDEIWTSKPLGPLPSPLTREWIYDLPGPK